MANDLRGTEAALKIEEYFDAIAKGNQGKARVEILEQEGSLIRYKIHIRHHDIFYSWLTSLTMYDITTSLQGEFDLRNPATYVDQYAYIDIGWGMGRVCVSLQPLAEAILVERQMAV